MAGKKITQLTSGSLSNLTLDSVLPITYSGTTFQHNSRHLRQILVDSGSHHFTGSQFINGDLTISGSAHFGDNINDLHRFTGSVLVSGSVNATGLFAKEVLYVSGFAVIGDTIHHSGSDPEALHVGTTDSYNIAHFKGDNDYYSQVYISNLNSGSNASTDLVIVADNGNESVHFIDLGINSSTYTGGLVGRENDAYLLNVGKDLYVGTVGGTNHPAKLHLFAENSWENPQITIHTGSQVTFNTSSFTEGYLYEFSGSVKLQNELSVNGSVTSNGATINEIANLESIVETIVPYEAPSSGITHNFIDGSIVYITGATSDILINITDVPTTNNKAIALTVIFEQGSTAYDVTGLQINSENEGSVLINWYGGSQPSGTINSTDIFAFSLIKVNNSWRVLGQKTSF